MTVLNPSRFALLFPGLLALAGCGCGGGDTTNPTAADAKYLVATRIFSPDGVDVTSYLHLVPSLDADTKVTLKHAVEVAGAVKVYALDDGWLAVGSGDRVTITRYELDRKRGLVATDNAIDLQPSGVRSLWDTLYVASETKVYYPDRDNAQLVIINPKAMTVEGTIKLPQTERDGYLSIYSYSALTRGDQLVFSVGWFDWTDDRVLPETGLVVLDTKTDKVTRFDVDDRCGGVTTPVTLASGDTYYVSSALNAAAKFVKRDAAKPCALRVLAGEDRFDAAYQLELSDVTGSSAAGEPVPAAGAGMFLRVLNENDIETEEGDASWDITGQSAWSWAKWEPGADGRANATTVKALKPSTADVTFFELGDRVFGAETTEDYAETTLVELNAEGGPKSALKVPGFASQVLPLE